MLSHRLPYFQYLCIAALLLSCGACNRPVWEDKTAAREQRIHDELNRFAEHEAAGTERLAYSARRAEQMYEYHVDHLRRTTDLVHNEFESDVSRWREERGKRSAYIRRYVHGEPESIPSTWARMVY